MDPIANESAALMGRVAPEASALKHRSRTTEKELDKDIAEMFIRRLCQLLDTEDFLEDRLLFHHRRRSNDCFSLPLKIRTNLILTARFLQKSVCRFLSCFRRWRA